MVEASEDVEIPQSAVALVLDSDQTSAERVEPPTTPVDDTTTSDGNGASSDSWAGNVSGSEASLPIPPGMRGRNRFPKQRRAVLLEWSAIIAVALAVAMLVRTFVVQAFWIPSASMVPTLKIGDRLLVEKITPSVRDIHRREIIVFERPEGVDPDLKDLIKRVIGLPGELIEGKDGKVLINGQPLAEPYLPKGVIPTELDFGPTRIPIDSYFVMGDNRSQSFDSRYWGTVARHQVVGRAVIRIWPITKVGSL
jgi:signal peptidase I